MRTANAFMDRIQLGPIEVGRDRLWADHISPVFDVEAYGNSFPRDTINMTTMLCDKLIFVSFKSPASKVVRSARKVSSLGSDHIHIQIYRSGTSTVQNGNRRIDVNPRQMVVFDLSQPVEVEAEPVSALGLIVPRALFQNLVGEPALLHSKAFGVDNCFSGRMLYNSLSQLDREMESIRPNELEALSNAVLALCTSCIPGADKSKYHKHLSRKSTICRYVDLNLSDTSLSVTSIASKFGLSRSTLQRMFENEGGFARYVREMRVQKALKLLVRSNMRASRTLSAVAFECGFEEATSFIRAFTRYFGLPPRELIEQSLSGSHPEARIMHNTRILSRWMSYIC